MQQPYSSYAKALLEIQRYPDLRLYPGGPPKRPYDVTAHTLPLLMGVTVNAIDQPAATNEPSAGGRSPSPDLSASDTDSWIAINRIWNSGGAVWRSMTTGDFGDSAKPGFQQLRRPRIGLYRSFVPSMDEGWTRWLLEQFGFAYTTVRNKDVQAGDLKQRFDVLVFPDQPVAELETGYRRGSMPEEFTGGLDVTGAAALRDFAQSGGTLLFLNHSTGYAIGHLSVKAKNVVEGISNREFYSPGSLLNAHLKTGHPLTLGLPEDIAIWSEQSPAWQTGEVTLASYPQSNILASGWLLGDKLLAGRSALVDVKIGNGHIILFGMRPQYRAQSYQTFKLFFNALVYQ
jgi:hypothetical protein